VRSAFPETYSRLKYLTLLTGIRIGEKFLDWVDQELDLEIILESVTLYWLTQTYPRSLYVYREVRFNPIVASVLTVFVADIFLD
jgi:hypothetical protein